MPDNDNPGRPGVRIGVPQQQAMTGRMMRLSLLPQVKMRAKADSLPHVIVRAC